MEGGGPDRPHSEARRRPLHYGSGSKPGRSESGMFSADRRVAHMGFHRRSPVPDLQPNSRMSRRAVAVDKFSLYIVSRCSFPSSFERTETAEAVFTI